VNLALALLIWARQVDHARLRDSGKFVRKICDELNQLTETLETISKEGSLRYPFDILLSNLLTSWWLAKVKETRNTDDPQLALQEELSSFAMLQEKISSVDRVAITLAGFRRNVKVLDDLFRDTSRIAWKDYNFVLPLAEIWCSFFQCKPTLSRNDYITTTDRRKSTPISPSRLFEPFIEEVVPEPTIGTEIIRSVLESLGPDWGDQVIKWADRNLPNTSDAT
jgi:hypothetical protein